MRVAVDLPGDLWQRAAGVAARWLETHVPRLPPPLARAVADDELARWCGLQVEEGLARLAEDGIDDPVFLALRNGLSRGGHATVTHGHAAWLCPPAGSRAHAFRVIRSGR